MCSITCTWRIIGRLSINKTTTSLGQTTNSVFDCALTLTLPSQRHPGNDAFCLLKILDANHLELFIFVGGTLAKRLLKYRTDDCQLFCREKGQIWDALYYAHCTRPDNCLVFIGKWAALLPCTASIPVASLTCSGHISISCEIKLLALSTSGWMDDLVWRPHLSIVFEP